MPPRALTTLATAAMIALSASATSPTPAAPAAPPDPMDDPEIRAAIEAIAMASGGFSVERVANAVRSILAEQEGADLERLRADLNTLPDLLARLTERCATAETPARSTPPRRSTGPRSYPRTPYEVALLARWPDALDGRRRARNSAEFSVVASHLGASEAEILAMIATIHRRSP